MQQLVLTVQPIKRSVVANTYLGRDFNILATFYLYQIVYACIVFYPPSANMLNYPVVRPWHVISDPAEFESSKLLLNPL